MPGLFHHMLLTLRLNFRSKQALVYGFVFPIGFLFAFWGIYYHKETPPLIGEMGQLLTVTILSGACFGMPTAMVGERERGVWRRYRLLPAGTGGIVASAMVVRVVLVAMAIVLQLVLARYVCKAAWPAHPLHLLGVFFFVAFAFLGLGLVIATLADNVPAVQAMGQAIFLPMLMIGGIGVRLEQLPEWARHVAAFLPGLYAVDAIDSAVRPKPLTYAVPLPYCLFALTLIGAAGCLAGRQMFRWDVGQKMTSAARGWVALALAVWLVVGISAEVGGHVRVRRPSSSLASARATTEPASAPTELTLTIGLSKSEQAALREQAQSAGLTADSYAAKLIRQGLESDRFAQTKSTQPTATATTEPSTRPSIMAQLAPWTAITPEDIAKITYDDLPSDQSTVTPVATGLDDLDDDGKKRMDDFTAKLDDWQPGKNVNLEQRVRNLLAVAAITDILQDQHEGQIAYIVFEHLRFDVEEEKLKKILAYISLHPEGGKVPTQIPELGIDGEVFEDGIRERVEMYARKLLARLVGKVPG
jgi:ABC-type multidrug transport system permease subunit